MEHPEDTSPTLDIVQDGLPVGTLVVSQSQMLVAGAKSYVDSKFESVSRVQILVM